MKGVASHAKTNVVSRLLNKGIDYATSSKKDK